MERVIYISPREKRNTQKISIFLSPEHLDSIRKEAEEKGIAVSGLIRMIVIDHLKRNEN